MDVRCEKCGSQYVLEDARVLPGGVMVRCTGCGNVFTVHSPRAAAIPTPAGGSPVAQPPRPQPQGATQVFAPPPLPAAGAAPPAARSGPDPIDAFEASFGVQPDPGDRGRRSSPVPMSAREIEEDVASLRRAGRLRYALSAVGLLVAAVLVVYLLDRPTFDRLFAGKPRVPEAAAAKLEQARAAARLDTVVGYQQSIALAREGFKLAGEVPFAAALAQIALADVGWADLLSARASQHQAVADGIQVTGEPKAPPPPACCPHDESARKGLEAFCQGKHPVNCSADEEIARAKAVEAFEEGKEEHAAMLDAQDRAKTGAIRDRADARARLEEAIGTIHKARQLDPDEVMVDVAFAAYDRSSGDPKAFAKVLARIEEEHRGAALAELDDQKALAAGDAHRLDALEQIARTQDGDARIHFALARQLELAGKLDRARSEAERAVAVSPEHDAARQLLRLLEQKARRAGNPGPAPEQVAPAAPVPPKADASEPPPAPDAKGLAQGAKAD